MRKVFEGEINTDTPIDLKVVSVSLIIESAVSNLILTTDDLEQEYSICNNRESTWIEVIGDGNFFFFFLFFLLLLVNIVVSLYIYKETKK